MSSVVKYFNGEKASFVFIAIGIVALIMAFYFYCNSKASFWRGVALPFMLVALLEFIVGYTIVKRSQKIFQELKVLLKCNQVKLHRMKYLEWKKT